MESVHCGHIGSGHAILGLSKGYTNRNIMFKHIERLGVSK
jgi:hypothetical protein